MDHRLAIFTALMLAPLAAWPQAGARDALADRGALGQTEHLRPVPFTYTEGQTAPRTEVRDPCVVREKDTYYLVFTM